MNLVKTDDAGMLTYVRSVTLLRDVFLVIRCAETDKTPLLLDN